MRLAHTRSQYSQALSAPFESKNHPSGHDFAVAAGRGAPYIHVQHDEETRAIEEASLPTVAGFDQTTGTVGGAVGKGRGVKACGRFQGRQIGSARQKERV
jgi:hypothetical protein